jgi:AcrR family transcriptional regulator
MPKIVDRELYRQELLDLSFRLFVDKGYGKITMRQLAEGMGVSTGTLYHYFPSKEEMFCQLIERQTQQDIAKFLAQTESVPPRLDLRLQAILGFVMENREYFIDQTKLSMDYFQQNSRDIEKINQIADKSSMETIDEIAKFLQTEDLDLAKFIFTFINGSIVCEIFQPGFTDWEKQGQILIKLVTQSIDK